MKNKKKKYTKKIYTKKKNDKRSIYIPNKKCKLTDWLSTSY